MNIGKSEAVGAPRQSAKRLRAEAAALDEKADLLERVETDLADRSDRQSAALSKDNAGDGAMDTLGHVWTSEAAGAYIATIEGALREHTGHTGCGSGVSGCRGVQEQRGDEETEGWPGESQGVRVRQKICQLAAVS